MIDSMAMLDDVVFARTMLEKQVLSNADLVFALRNLLRMKYYPVAIKFFFERAELDIPEFNQQVQHLRQRPQEEFCISDIFWGDC
jgi:uncharacterized protein (DUF169 family)